MTCRELTDFILAYMDDSLPPVVRSRFDRHLALCPRCVAYLDAYQGAMALGRAAFEREDRDVEQAGVPDTLVRGILNSLSGRTGDPVTG